MVVIGEYDDAQWLCYAVQCSAAQLMLIALTECMKSLLLPVRWINELGTKSSAGVLGGPSAADRQH